ncbi:glycosyltransferase [Telluribacter sp.]|jgi:glycosyltransferase involved in cell wall biosynthesis|uniref:glycosyltransferase n=1 Tax=Telluribacter sp. TaxID=1978767 RepID=UPI002E0E894F|nr:glycosyltransferase [Telluribacter sp.]
MIETINIILLVLIGSYAVFTTGLVVLWFSIPKKTCPKASTTITLSVIVPVRNEAQNILQLLRDLEQQSLPNQQFEVIIVDDASTDQTVELVRQFQATSTCPIYLLELSDVFTESPKKRAIESAIHTAKGTLIVTTDGDCRVGSGWLEAIANCYEQTQARLISGPVTFTAEQGLMDHLQTVEFSSLIGSGACAIAAGKPTMCNGANLTYPKAVFMEVGGFEGVRHIASGDDEFLMHKIASKYPRDIYFLKQDESVVQTTAHKEWRQFYRQRKRWASKWKHYKSLVPQALALYIFSCNAALILAIALAVSGFMSFSTLLTILLLKWVPEWFFIGSILSFLKKKKSIPYIPLVQVVYPFYVTFFGLVVQHPEYEWKGRKLV